jgi:hypothetical protein
MTPIGSLIRVGLVEVAAGADPFFVTALWCGCFARDVLIAAG